MMITGLLAALLLFAGPIPSDWQKARDSQDRASLDRIAAAATSQAESAAGDAQAQYRAALAESLKSEVAMEQRDKGAAGAAAESGIRAAQRAVKLKPDSAEYHRILGTLCGQVIPANVLSGLRYGRCALDEVSRAIELDGKSALAWMSRGVGNYYLPGSFGGGFDKALADFDKSLSLDAKNADAHLWRGLALRQLKRNAEARKAIETSLKLNPARVWAKQQLDKTPAQ